MPNNPRPLLLPIDDAAKYLGVSAKTLRRWEAKSLLIPSRTSGGHRRYSRTKLLYFKRSGQKSIDEAAEILGVSTKTLRRWESQGKISPLRTTGGHRRYELPKLLAFKRQLAREKIRKAPFRPAQPSVYPTQEAKEKVLKEFYEALPYLYQTLPKTQKRILVGGLVLLSMLVLIASISNFSTLTDYIKGTQQKLSKESDYQKIKALKEKIAQEETKEVVLAATTFQSIKFNVNVESTFADDASFLENLAVTKDASVSGNLAVNGGNITSTASTVNLINTASSTLNIGGAATAISVGATTGTTTVNNDLSVTGNLDVNGDTSDIAGTLNLSGGILTASDDLLVDPTGNDVTVDGDLILSDTFTLQVGGKTATTYNAFANSGDAPDEAAISSDNDVYVGGDLEVDGTLYANAVAGVVSGTGTSGYLPKWSTSTALTDSVIFETSSKIGIGTASPISKLSIEGAIAGRALVSLNETGDQDIFTASASGIPVFTIGRTGNLALNQNSQINTAGTLLLDSTGTLSINTTNNSAITTGTGQITLTGNVDATNGLDVTTANLTVGGANFTVAPATGNITTAGDLAVNGGDITSTGDLAIVPTGGDVNITGNLDASGTLAVGTSDALTIDASGNLITTGTADFRNALGITLGYDTGTNVAGYLRLISNGSNNFSTVFQAGTQTQDVTYTLPLNDGSPNYLLITDGGGTLSWQSITGIGAVTGTGAAGQVTFWGGISSITGENNFWWDSTNDLLGVGTNAPVGKLHVTGAVPGKALAIFDETGDQNILTASASGVTVANLDRSGNFSLYSQGDIRLYDSDGSNYTGFQSPSNLTSDLLMTLPANIGNPNYILTTDGSGTLSWQAGGSGTVTGTGAAGQVTFWDGISSITGENNFWWDSTNDLLGVGTNAPVGKLHVTGAVPGKALAIFDETGNQAILTASASGVPVFTVGRTGILSLNQDSQINTAGTLLLDSTGTLSINTTNNSAITTGTGQITLTGNVDATNGLDVTTANLTVGGANFSVAPGTGNITTAGTFTLPNSNTLTGVASYTQLSGGISVGGATTYYLDSSGNLNAGGITGAGTLDINGAGTHDIAGTLNLSGNTLTSSANLAITPTGGATNITGNLDVSGTLAVGTSDALTVDTSGNLITTGTGDFRNASGITLGYDTGTNVAGYLRLISAGSNNFSTVFTTGTQTQDVAYTLPLDDGSPNYVLTTNGGGTLSWGAAGSGTVTGSGSPEQIALWSGANSIMGENSLWWDTTNDLLGVGTNAPVGKLHVTGAVPGKALAIFDETGDQNILTASASGVTVANLDRSGNLSLYSQADIRLYDSDGSNYTGFQAPSNLTSDLVMALPANAGSPNYVLTTDGSGTLSWLQAPGVGGVSGTGASGQVTFWNGVSSITGENNFWWDSTNDLLGVGTNAPVGKLHVTGAVPGKALAIFDETGDQAILTASESGTTRFIIEDGGNVGVGIADPSSLLHIKGSTPYLSIQRDADTEQAFVSFKGSADNQLYSMGMDGSENFFIWDQVLNANVITIPQNTGNVGIGDATPDARLDVEADSEQLRLSRDTDEANDFVSFTVDTNGDLTIAPNGADSNITGNLDISATLAVGTANALTADASGNLITTGTGDFRNASGITLGYDTATNVAGYLKLISGGTNNFSTVFTTGTQTQDVAYTLPLDDGTSNYVLATDGSGTLSWQSVSGVGGMSGSGAAGQVTFWNGPSSVTGENNFWWDSTNDRLGIGTSTPSADLEVSKVDPEIRLTDTGNNEYSRLTRADTLNKFALYNRVIRLKVDPYALSFDGNDEVQVPDDLTLWLVGGDFTIRGWIYLNSAASSYSRTIVEKVGTAYARDWNVGIDTNRRLVFNHWGDNPGSYTSTAAVPLATWTHVQVSVDQTSDKVYLAIDGTVEEQNFTSAFELEWQYDGVLRIGKDSGEPPALEDFNGYIDELELSDTVRNTSNFTPSIYNLSPDANTEALWHFDEGTGLSLGDSGVNDNDGVLSGPPATPTWVTGYVTEIDTIVEAEVLSSQDGALANEAGIQKFGYEFGGTWFRGKTQRFYIGADEVMRINASGNIGIGTTSPVGKLQLEGAAVGKALAIFNETGDQDIFTASSSGTTRFVIQNNGNVGIGTTTPGATLEISGVVDGPGYDDSLLIQGTGQPILRMDDTGDATSLGFQLRQTSEILTVERRQDDITVNGMLVFDYAGSEILSYMPVNIDLASTFGSGVPLRVEHVSSPSTDYLQVATSGASGGDILTIDSGGRVGIGTPSPDELLEVEGAVTGKALVSLNEQGDQNILTASASGTTVATLDRNGELRLNSTTANADIIRLDPNSTGAATFTGTITSADLSADRIYTLPDTTDGTFCLSSGNCAGGAGGSKWTDDGAITYLTSQTDNLAVGGTDSTSEFFIDITNGGTLTLNSTGDTENIFDVNANSLTTGSGIDVSSTATAFNGELLVLNKTGASGSTAFTSDIANITYSQTFNVAPGDSTGNVLDISRSITIDDGTAGGITGTVSGTGVTISDTCTQGTADTCTWTADTLRLAQNFTGANAAVLNITTASTSSGTSNFALRVNDDGTFTDSTPFIIDEAGQVGIGTTTPGYKLEVTGSGYFGGPLSISHVSSTDITALSVDLSRSTTTASSIKGANILAIMSGGSGTQTNVVGILGEARNSAASITIENAQAIYGRVQNTDTGTITNAYSFYAANPVNSGGGTLSNAYGVYIENITTGSSSNFALYSAGGTNYFGGNVGINVTTPDDLLDITQTSTTGSGLEMYRNLTSTSTDAPLVFIHQDHASDDQNALQIQNEGTGAGLGITNLGTGDIVNFFDGANEVFTILDGGAVGINSPSVTSGYMLQIVGGALCVDDATSNCPSSPTSGAIYVENSVGSGNVSAFDIAEYYPATEAVEKGNVVIADSQNEGFVKKSTEAYQSSVIGIVSTNPGFIMDENNITFGKNLGDSFNPLKPYVALAGRAPVKIAPSSQAVSPGDFITTSSESGLAMKAIGAGYVIGRALDSWTPDSGRDQIMVFVGNSWHEPNLALSDLGNLQVARNDQFSISNDQLTSNYQVQDGLGNIVERVGVFATFVAGNIKAGAIETKDFAVQGSAIVSENIQAGAVETKNLVVDGSAFVSENIKAGAIETGSVFAGTLETATAKVDNLLVTTGLVSPSIKTQNLEPLEGSKDLAIKIGDGNQESGFGKLLIQNSQGETVASIDEIGNATFSGQVTSDELQVTNNASIAGELRAGKIYADEIVSKDAKFADTSTNTLSALSREQIEELLKQAQLDQSLMNQADTWNVNTSTDSAHLNELALENLYVTGTAAIDNLSLTKSVVIGTDLVISSLINEATNQLTSSIDTLSAPLSLQSSAAQPLEIMAGLVAIDTSGNVRIAGNLAVGGTIESSGLTLKESLRVGDPPGSETGFGKLLSLYNSEGAEVAWLTATGSATFASLSTSKISLTDDPTATASATFAGLVYTSSATAGSAKVPLGSRDVIIKNPNVTADSLVFVTPTSEAPNPLFVKQQSEGEFIVGFSNAAAEDVTFNWWVVELAKEASAE